MLIRCGRQPVSQAPVPHPAVLNSVLWSPSTLKRVTHAHSVRYYRKGRVWLLRPAHKRCCGFLLPLFFWITWSGRSQLMCFKDLQIASRKDGCSKELRPITSNTNMPALGVCHLGTESSSPSQRFRHFRCRQPQVPSDHNLMRDPKPELSTKLFVNPWLTDTVGDKNVYYCF